MAEVAVDISSPQSPGVGTTVPPSIMTSGSCTSAPGTEMVSL